MCENLNKIADKLYSEVMGDLQKIVLEHNGSDILLESPVGHIIDLSQSGALIKGGGKMIIIHEDETVKKGFVFLDKNTTSIIHNHKMLIEEFFVEDGELVVAIYGEDEKLISEKQYCRHDKAKIDKGIFHQTITKDAYVSMILTLKK